MSERNVGPASEEDNSESSYVHPDDTHLYKSGSSYDPSDGL